MASVDTTAAQSTNGRGSGAEIPVENPATGEVIAHVADLHRRRGRRARPPRPRRAARLAGARLRRPRAASCGACASGSWTTPSASCDTIVAETGKTYEDAYLVELLYTGGALTYWAKHAKRLLADERVARRTLAVKGKKLVHALRAARARRHHRPVELPADQLVRRLRSRRCWPATASSSSRRSSRR